MYDELVKRLHQRIALSPAGSPLQDDLKEAADAIEELSHEYESIEASLNKSVELVRKLQSPRWVSVTERLPDAYEDVLLQFPNNQAAGFCDRDGCWGVYSGDGFYTEVADNEPKPTHWAKKLPEPPKEEARITVTCTKCPCKGACDELPEDMSCEDVLAYYAIEPPKEEDNDRT